MKKAIILTILVVLGFEVFAETYSSFYESTKGKTTAELNTLVEEKQAKLEELTTEITKLEKVVKKAESKRRESGSTDVDIKLINNRNNLESKKYEILVLNSELNNLREVLKARLDLEKAKQRLANEELDLENAEKKLEKFPDNESTKQYIEFTKKMIDSSKSSIEFYEKVLKRVEK